MSDVIEMLVMTVPQEQAWLTLLELYEEDPGHWTLVGGQMVHLWCAERGKRVARPTDDADAVLDVRMKKSILWDFTAALKARGFKPETGTPASSTDGARVMPSSTYSFLKIWGPIVRISKAQGVGLLSQPPGRRRSSTALNSCRFGSVTAAERFRGPHFSAR